MRKIFFIFGLILLNSCGFKIVQNDQFSKYYIAEVNAVGDSKINYRIKNKILTSAIIANKIPVIINLETKKEKLIKEKNVQNEITKYNLKINTTAKIKIKDKPELKTFKITKVGSYSVSSRYSDTRNNENKLAKNLTNEIANDVKKQLSFILD